jgi:acyl dehydratase
VPGWDDLEEGTANEPRQYGPITRTDIVRYQGASGDFNPIHHDDEFAQKAGFPSVFSVGMLTAGILASYATDWLGAANVRRFSVVLGKRLPEVRGGWRTPRRPRIALHPRRVGRRGGQG